MFKRLGKAIKKNVLVGLFLTVPIGGTILIFWLILKFTTQWLPEEVLPIGLRDRWYGQLALHGIALCTVVIVLYAAGLFTRNIIGRHLLRFSDKLLSRIPFIKGIYRSVGQVSESLFTQRKTLFQEVVLVQYPRKGIYTMAFVTGTVPQNDMGIKLDSGSDEPLVTLFVPTTPNPTSGVLIIVPRSEVTPMDLPVSDAVTFIMSAGAVRPGKSNKNLSPTLLDKLEAWLKQETNTGKSINNER